MDNWEEQCEFLLDELIKQSKTINYLAERNIWLSNEILGLAKVFRTMSTSIKYVIPHIKEMVDTYDSVEGCLSKNVLPRLKELEEKQPKEREF